MVTGIAGSPQQAAANPVVVNMSPSATQVEQKKSGDNRRVSFRFVCLFFFALFFFFFCGTDVFFYLCQ